MIDHVFVGPSLDAATVHALLPGAHVHPPVAHGDLLGLPAAPGDRVFLIDGLFMQAAPVRHREILALLEQGVAVAGSSSMGALRAAELWRFGMRGIGEVFRLYAEGVIDGDDEVAMAYAPADEGYRALSEPLVNIRLALRDAGAAGVITAEEEQSLVNAARALPFRARSYRALAGSGGPASNTFLDWLHNHPRDAKAADARLLLRSAAAIAPPGPADDPALHVNSTFYVAWQVRSTGRQAGDAWISEHDIIVALMLLHPQYPQLHRRDTLAAVAGVSPADPRVERLALDTAREHGILDHGWSPEPGLDADERLLRVLARGFGTVGDQAIAGHLLPVALDTEENRRVAAEFIAGAELVNARLPRPDPHVPQTRRRFSDERIDGVFAKAWSVDAAGFETAVWDRGLRSVEEFRVVAERFVAGLRMFGTPKFPRMEP